MVPNRLDIELTSARGDGSYTWRAAGARQPKGVIDAKVLADGAKVGDVLRVEAEVEIDGITILSVLPPKEKAVTSGRIEFLGSPKPIPAVTTVLVSEGGRGRGGDRRDLLDSPRRGDRSGSRDHRPPREGDRAGARRPDSTAGSPPAAGERRPERRPRPEGSPDSGSPRTAQGRPGGTGGERRPSAAGSDRRPGAAGAERRSGAPGGERRPGAAAGSRRPGAPAGERSRTDTRQPAASRPGQPEPTTRRAPPRFEPGSVHRDALIAGLAPEQRPIAERLAAGGIPAVRRAVAEERERARAEGRPEATGEAILTLAEQLAPTVKQAIWLDRAEAALAQLDRISLRDLRTTVVAAMPRDETARELDRKLREELDRRVTKLRSNWEEQITHALEEGRVLQALRLSAQPPEPTARFPAGLVERLATSAGAAMTSSTPTERWLAILDAATSSPIRRQIHPEGLPEDPSGEILRKARVAAGSLPALAPLLGLSMPPPPKPLRAAGRPPRPPRPPRPLVRPERPTVPPDTPAANESAAPAPEVSEPDAVHEPPVSDELPAPEVSEPDAVHEPPGSDELPAPEASESDAVHEPPGSDELPAPEASEPDESRTQDELPDPGTQRSSPAVDEAPG